MITIQEVLPLAEGELKRATLIAEEDIQKYVTDLENEYVKVKTSAELQIKNLEDQVAAEEARIADAVRKAESSLAHAIEAKIHELGKELKQEYENTKGFVARIFAGMAAHLQPGSVAAYDVQQPAQQVSQQKLHPEAVNPVTGKVEVDLTRTQMETADRSGGVPDITK